MVTLDLDTLLTGIGVATTSTGERITAEQARRLACQARIIPVVLGRRGEVLDLGRAARLFSPAQRKALGRSATGVHHRRLQRPRGLVRSPPRRPARCRGGTTDLADGTLLCSFHHHRAHDPAWKTHHHPNGSDDLPPTDVTGSRSAVADGRGHPGGLVLVWVALVAALYWAGASRTTRQA